MQIVSFGNNLHEMSNLFSVKNKKHTMCSNMLSAEILLKQVHYMTMHACSILLVFLPRAKKASHEKYILSSSEKNCATKEDLVQLEHMPRLISLHCLHIKASDPWPSLECPKKILIRLPRGRSIGDSRGTTDLDLHCLQRQGIYRFSRTREDIAYLWPHAVQIEPHFQKSCYQPCCLEVDLSVWWRGVVVEGGGHCCCWGSGGNRSSDTFSYTVAQLTFTTLGKLIRWQIDIWASAIRPV